MARTPEEREKLIDAILDEYEAGVDKFNRDGWASKHSEKLGPYVEKMKALNGDDFDFLNAAYDEYHKDYSDLSEDEYCDALVSNIEKVIGKLKSALDSGNIEEAKEAVDEIQETTNEIQAEEEKEEPIDSVEVVTDDPEVAKDVIDEVTEDEEPISEEDDFQKSLDEEYEKTDKSRKNY